MTTVSTDFERMSHQLDVWAAGMYAVQRDLTQPVKRTQGQVRGRRDYVYLNLPDLIEHLTPVLKEHSMFFTQDTRGVSGGTEITTTVWTNAGPQWVTFGPLFMPHGADPQAVGSAITYGRRYHLLALFGLAAEDDDGASASSSPAQSEASTAPATVTSGRGGDSERAGGEATGEGVTPPAHTQPTDAQRWMEEFHPGKPHKMVQSETVPQQRYCEQWTIGDAPCPYATWEEGAKR